MNDLLHALLFIGIAGAVIATYGGQALGLYQVGETAGFIGSVFGAIVLLVLLRVVVEDILLIILA